MEENLLDRDIPEERLSFDCALCKFAGPGKLALMGHVRTVQHLQMEQVHQLQKRAEGNITHTEISDIFQVTDSRDEDMPQTKQEKGKQTIYFSGGSNILFIAGQSKYESMTKMGK